MEDHSLKGSKTLTWETAPDVLTVDEAAALLRIPRNAAYEAVRFGFLPAVKLGKRRIRVAKGVLMQVFGVVAEQKAATAALSHGRV